MKWKQKNIFSLSVLIYNTHTHTYIYKVYKKYFIASKVIQNKTLFICKMYPLRTRKFFFQDLNSLSFSDYNKYFTFYVLTPDHKININAILYSPSG